MSFVNNVKTTIQTAFNATATSIQVLKAVTPFNNPPESGTLTFMDSLSSPTKIEVVTYTGRTDNGSYWTITGVTRGQESSTASSFDVDAYVIQTWTAEHANIATTRINGVENSVEFIATEGQTTFTTPYDAGYLDVYLNGILLATTDYTATDNANIILDVGASVSDVVYIQAFGTFAFADHYNKTDADALLADKLSLTGGVLTGSLTATDFVGPLNGPIRFTAKNTSGGTLTVGQVVYISGISGNTPTVGLADADDSAKMPAYGLVAVETVNNEPVEVITFGALTNVKTDYAGWALGDTLYVSTTAGELTNTAPAGESSLIQNLGRIRRLHLSAGSITVGGAGRTNATPNLNNGNVFIGDATNHSVARALVVADTTGLQSALDGKTTEAYVGTQIAALVDSSPATLDTLNELAAALGDDPNFATTVTTSIGEKLPLAGGTLTGDVAHGDNVKAKFGAGDDLQIYHDGINSYIKDVGTGALVLQSNGTAFVIEKTDGENMILAETDGAVTLYNNGASKLATTSTGVDVTGTVTTDGLVTQGDLTFTNGNPLIVGGDTDGSLAIGGYLTNSGANVTMYGPTAANANDMTFRANTTKWMEYDHSLGAIAMTGNVGIGNSSPTSNLTIGDSSGNGLEFTYDATNAYRNKITNYWNSSADTRMDFDIGRTGGVAPVTVMSVGYNSNVGIGTSSPEDKISLDQPYVASGEMAISFNQSNFANRAAKIIHKMDASGNGGSLLLATNSNGGDATERMRIDSLGKVGIGTSSPSAKLDVVGSSNSTYLIAGGDDSYSGNGRGLTFTSSASAAFAGAIHTINAPSSQGEYRFQITGSEKMRIDSSGNVGIGTNNPSQAKLEVLAESDYSSHTGHGLSILSNTADVYTALYIGTDDTIDSAYIQSAGKNFSFTSKDLLLNPNGGNVGIGTSGPTATLNVSSPQIATTGSVWSNLNTKLTASSTINNGGYTALGFATSTVENYGFSMGGLRAGATGIPSFVIKSHNNSNTGVDALLIDNNGIVTTPNQPSWNLAPNHSGGQLFTAGKFTYPFGAQGSNAYVNNVTVSSTGLVTVPVSGKYLIMSMIRVENNTADKELSLYKNGVAVARSGIWYDAQPYETVHLHTIVDLSANDYLEMKFNNGANVNIAGYNDTLTFFSGHLIG